MKTRLLALAFPLAVLSALPGLAADPGDIGIYFDPAGTTTSDVVAPFEIKSFYVIATNVPRELNAFELLINVDPRVTLASEYPHPDIVFNFCSDLSPNMQNYCVGLASCIDGTAILLRWDAFLLEASEDLTFCLEPSTITSVSPPAPSYAPCLPPLGAQAFTAAYDGCAVWNPVTLEPPVATEPASWGSLKGRY